MKTPDITPAQMVALAKALIGLAATFGLVLSDAQTSSILAVVGLVASLVIPLIVGDAVIRNGRSRILANQTLRDLESLKPPAKAVRYED